MSSNLGVTLDLEVPFFDVDSYRVAWHGSYVKYFEVARCKLLEYIDYRYEDMEKSGYIFPIIDLQIKYIRPLLFGQKFSITASLIEWEHRLIIRYVILDKETGEKITKGQTTQVAVAMPDQVTQFISPQILLDKIAKALRKL